MIAVWFRPPYKEDKPTGDFQERTVKTLLRCLLDIVCILLETHKLLRALVGKTRSLAQAIGTSKSRRWRKTTDQLTDDKIALFRGHLGTSPLFAQKLMVTGISATQANLNSACAR